MSVTDLTDSDRVESVAEQVATLFDRATDLFTTAAKALVAVAALAMWTFMWTGSARSAAEGGRMGDAALAGGMVVLGLVVVAALAYRRLSS
jgi:hypothetical protein